MNIDWKQWMQILSNMAILVGIGLVVFELQQTRSLSRAQLLSDRVAQRVDIALALAGENPDLIMMTACLEPNNLSSQDKFVCYTPACEWPTAIFSQAYVPQPAPIIKGVIEPI